MAAQPPQVEPLLATGPNQPFDLDLLLGLPAAVRFGGAVFRHNGTAFLLEGMAGLEAVLPFAAVGSRFRFTPCYGKRNAFVLKPGVDFYGVYDPFADLLGGPGTNAFGFAVGADVECLWYHNCDRCGWELGVDLGALIGAETGRALPIVSLVAGLRF